MRRPMLSQPRVQQDHDTRIADDCGDLAVVNISLRDKDMHHDPLAATDKSRLRAM